MGTYDRQPEFGLGLFARVSQIGTGAYEAAGLILEAIKRAKEPTRPGRRLGRFYRQAIRPGAFP